MSPQVDGITAQLEIIHNENMVNEKLYGKRGEKINSKLVDVCFHFHFTSGLDTSVSATLPRSFLNIRLKSDISLSNKKRKNSLVHEV
jgi:hypothetical protein